jgi:molybdopterin/thiamine biosynthesis adenylyltransferase
MGKGSSECGAMDDLYKSIFSRNIGFFTESEQERLRKSTIAISGMGGIGGLLAERLTRLGVGQLRILDPGAFERSNFNRQLCSSMSTLGQNKAEAVFMHIKEINPQAKIQWSNTGIKTQSDATLFVKGCDLIVDAMDFGLFRESVFLQRAARRKGIYYMLASAIGFGALVVIFDPNGLTLEEYDNLSPDIDLDSAEEIAVPFERICPVIPSYATATSAEAELIIRQIITGERGGTTTSIGVGLASVLAANEALNVILRKRDIASAPHYTYVDLLDRKFLVGTAL